MGAAKEHRDAAAVARMYSDRIREVNNTNDARALFWRDLMNEGHILTFKHAPTQRTFTAGKYQTATGGYCQFALLWSGRIPRNMRDWFGLQAWDIAVRIIQHVGRQRPVFIDGEKSMSKDQAMDLRAAILKAAREAEKVAYERGALNTTSFERRLFGLIEGLERLAKEPKPRRMRGNEALLNHNDCLIHGSEHDWRPSCDCDPKCQPVEGE